LTLATIEDTTVFAKKMADNERRHERAIREGNKETARKLKEQKDKLNAQKVKHNEDMKIMDRNFKESQKKLEQQIEELMTKNEEAAEKAKNDERELREIKKREVDRDKDLKDLRDKTAQSEAVWETKMDGLRAEQKRTNDGYEARLKALTAEKESDIPKKSIGATILGVGTMVLGAVTFQPAVVIAGAAVAGGGGLSMARRAMK
jgi:chromosome segregation ATPase